MRPLTHVAFLVCSQGAEVLRPRVVMATADTKLWYRNARDETDESIAFSPDDPWSLVVKRLHKLFLHPRVLSKVDLQILPEKPFKLSYRRATRLVGLVQSFRPEPGRWFLQFERYDSKETLEIGSFADRAAAIAWARTAASGLREGGTITPMEGWYRVLSE